MVVAEPLKVYVEENVISRHIQNVSRGAWVPDELRARISAYSPRTDLGRIVKQCFGYLPAEMAAELLETITRSVVIESGLSARAIRADGATEDYGVVSRKVITTAGVGFLVDSWQNLVELEVMKFHGIGTGTTAEAAADTALVTELTTQYNPDSTRATGTTAENAANVFRTVATNTVDVAVSIAEHGVFNAAAAATGTLWDRSVFTAIALANGDSLQTTYDCTASSGG